MESGSAAPGEFRGALRVETSLILSLMALCAEFPSSAFEDGSALVADAADVEWRG